MATFIRGSNPIWSMVDLVGKQFDDNFYMWVLENDIPYIPASVYHDSSGQIPWTDPIRFLANGTLPVDIFWDPDVVYRLEFRENLGLAPPSQSDPLIYLVENYAPGASGSTPVDQASLFSDNQVTNPQFSQILFSDPYELINASGPLSIPVAPGWFLDLEGIGNVTLSRVALNSTIPNPTNAPYALRISLSGNWSGNPILRQRFDQNGILWSNKWVSCSITARLETALPQQLSARLVDSQGQPLIQVLSSVINSSFNEYKGHGLVPDSTNTDIPPNAWVDLQILLPADVDIYLTSIQLIESDVPLEYSYEQNTIERQVDHTFHYYYNSLVTKGKDSIVSGWDFPLNPYQFRATSVTTVTSQCQYIADQTILYQIQAGATMQAGMAPFSARNGLLIKSLSGFPDNRFALIQYLDPASCRPYWGYFLSSLVKSRIFTTHGTQVGIKMRLIYSSTLPNTINSTNPIASWTQLNPVFDAQWTEIIPENDPIYILQNSQGANSEFDAYPFLRFQLPALTTGTQTLGVVIYTTENMNNAAGTEDSIVFDQISLIPSEIACEYNAKTYDQTLQECEYYYESSYDRGIVPGTGLAAGFLQRSQRLRDPTWSSTPAFITGEFSFGFKSVKRAPVAEGNVTFYSSGASGASAAVFGILYNNGTIVASGDITFADFPTPNWTFGNAGTKNISYITQNLLAKFLTAVVPNIPYSLIQFHYTIDVRLGL